ncbi:hypothetical protein ABQJ54_11310 [Rhodanobacter sp. Si-c]|uniref:Uncharacterized protein n=1 Tax=Rhodanobacter lycopersici TaxID=3162487 RepID=A0ABV3QES7_9GAMM
MQTLKLSVSLPDDAYPDMELRVSTNDTEYDVVIAMPTCVPAGVNATSAAATNREENEYVLGGYAGI